MRDHGKQTAGTGQYRSCVFVPNLRGKDGAMAATVDYKIVAAAREAVDDLLPLVHLRGKGGGRERGEDIGSGNGGPTSDPVCGGLDEKVQT